MAWDLTLNSITQLPEHKAAPTEETLHTGRRSSATNAEVSVPWPGRTVLGLSALVRSGSTAGHEYMGVSKN